MKAEAEKYAEEDKKRKEVVEIKNQYDSIAFQMDKMVNEKPDAFSDEEKTKVKEYMEDAKKVREDQAISKEDIQKKIDEIQKFAQEIAQKAAQAQQ